MDLSNLGLNDLRRAVFLKIKICINLLDEVLKTKQENIFELVDKEKALKNLELETMAESYRMLVVNYLIAIVGNRENDKISIYNKPIADKMNEINKFYKDHGNELRELYEWRNKIYSHIDTNTSKVKDLSAEYFKIYIDFAASILDIQLKDFFYEQE